ncbi:transposase [Rhodococcus opacus]|nr:transposase [Rhodococcus opacus]
MRAVPALVTFRSVGEGSHRVARTRRRRDGDAQSEPPGAVATEPTDHALGRSRGGWTEDTSCLRAGPQTSLDRGHRRPVRRQSAVTTVIDRIRLPRTGGGRPRTRPDAVLADKAYSSAANRDYLRNAESARPSRPRPTSPPIGRGRARPVARPPVFDTEHYKQQAVECGINQLKQNRSVATRYDKLAVRYTATVHIPAINQWLRASDF